MNYLETIRELQVRPALTDVVIELLRTVRDLEARLAHVQSRLEAVIREQARERERRPERVDAVSRLTV